MMEILIITYILIVPVLCIAFYLVGKTRGMETVIDINSEYDRRFEEMIVDFVTEKYQKKGENVEKDKTHPE